MVVVVSCVAQPDNIIAPMAAPATNSNVFMNYSIAMCSEGESSGTTSAAPLVCQSQLSASSEAYFTFKVIFFVRFPSSVFVE